LNIELLQTIIEGESNPEISSLISRIKLKFEEKKNLREKLSKTKGKILIDKQIVEECRRNIDENEEYFNEQIKEFEENRINKEEYIKIFEKKLKEVEIYIVKNTKNNADSPFTPYKDWKINSFIEENTDLMRKRENLNRSLNRILEKKEEIEKENEIYYNKNDEDFSFHNENTNMNSIYNNEICLIEGVKNTKEDGKEKIKTRLRSYFKFFTNQMKVLTLRTNLMRNYFERMSTSLKYFNSSTCNFLFNFSAENYKSILEYHST